jgi:hypothetical protein
LTNLQPALAGLALPFFDSLLPGDTPNKLKIKNHREPGLIKRAAFAEKISLAKVCLSICSLGF